MAFNLVSSDIAQLQRLGKKGERNLNIAKDRMQGATFRELSKKYGISDASVSYVLSKDEIRDVLDTALNHLASFSPIVVKNYRELLNSKSENIRLKATQALAEILGIKPGANPSVINNLYLQQNNIIGISDTMREVIRGISGVGRADADVIDAEFAEILDT